MSTLFFYRLKKIKHLLLHPILSYAAVEEFLYFLNYRLIPFQKAISYQNDTQAERYYLHVSNFYLTLFLHIYNLYHPVLQISTGQYS